MGANQGVGEPGVRAGVNSVENRSAGERARTPQLVGPHGRGMGWGSHGLMWCIVLTLLVIALPRPIQEWLLSGGPASAKVAGASTTTSAAELHVLREQVVQLQAAVSLMHKPPSVLPNKAQAPISNLVDPLRPVADIAKMTLDASKDKYDSIKDTYDKLFSVLAAMAALLTFFGFKGMDSFVAARRNTEEAVQQAEQARELADQSALRLKQFLDVDYGHDNRAEINLAQAVSLREIAALYEKNWQLFNPGKDLPEHGRQTYRQYLEKANDYLRASLRFQDKLDKVLLLRALGVQCNVFKMLGDQEGALRTAKEMIDRFPGEDESAYFNAACYCCLLAERHKDERIRSEKLLIDALAYLKKAIELYPENRQVAQDDPDFQALRVNRKQEFEVLVNAK